jgi:hypothetical protein
MGLTRNNLVLPSVAVDTAIADSGPIDYRGWAGGEVGAPAGSSLTTLTWYTCTTRDGTYLLKKDGFGNTVATTIAASQSAEIPKSLFGAMFLKIVGNADGAVNVSLKG